MPPRNRQREGGGIASLIRQAGADARAVADGQVGAGGTRIFSVLDYIEQPWGLGMKLFPVQRFIVKLYYSIPLEERIKTIDVPDMFGSKVLHRFTEVEYLHYLFNEGRCNIGEQDHERRELLLAIGRRAGKTTLSGIFASYEVYRLLNLDNPQGYYGLPNGNRIQIISVATDKDQAGLLFNEVTSHLARCEYFQPFVANNTQSYVQFRTPQDIARYGPTVRQDGGKFVSFNGKASIRLTFKSCIAKGLRGAGNIVVILDEMAHFQDKGQSSARDIYDAIAPSTAAFSHKDQNTGMPIGLVESRIICISSPLNREGKFYELYHQAMTRGAGSDNMLAIQAPTWEVNPTLPASYYKQKYHADANVFMTEHGANFSDQVRGWIDREKDLTTCINPDARPQIRGVPRAPHTMGVDVGLVGDGTAIAICGEENGKTAIVYHEVWYAGMDWREANPHLGQEYPTDYAKTLATVERLDFDEISKWIMALCRRFHIVDGVFDRWNGIPLEQALHKAGLRQFRSEFFTRDVSSKIFQTFKMMMIDEQIQLYDWPIPERGVLHSPLIAELLSLQAQQLSKNMVVVQAPQTVGMHDDVADAVARAVWLMAERLLNTKYVSRASQIGGPNQPGRMTVGRYQMARARKHGGFNERTIPQRIGVRMRSR